MTPGGAAEVAEARPADEPTAASSGPRRLRSLDVVRGLAILIMLVAMNPAGNQHRPGWLSHPSWHGLSFADLFFPLFLFAVGVSMTLSRRALDPRHMLRRVGLLFALGVGLAFLKYERLFLTGVLQHIAGSYLLAWVVLRAPRRYQLAIVTGLVAAVWAGFVLWAWGEDPWGRGDTLAHAVDGWLYGGFRTEGTLQTAISAATVVGGAFAGRLLQEARDLGHLVQALLVRAVGLVGLGLLLGLVVPVGKRLWTPSFTALTLGTSFAFLALGVWLVDIRGARRAVAPLVHLGTNPITVYVLFLATLTLLAKHASGLTPELAPLGHPGLGFAAYAAGWAALWWLVAAALYRRRIFIKV